MAAVRGKKTPGKPGRFDPSEPLHMTTRRAAGKSGPTNGSSSANGSMEDTGSRRGSLDDLRPFTSHSNGSQLSAKSRRLSDLSAVNNVSPSDGQMNGFQSQPSSEEKGSSGVKLRLIPPVAPAPSPTRKRKRSPSSPMEPPSVEQPDSVPSASFATYQSGLSFADDEEDVVDVVPPEDLSDREREPSQESFDSEADATQGDVAMAEASIDATPAASEPVSPATSESRSHEDALTKPLDAALEKITQQAVDDEQDDQEEPDEAVDAGEEVEVDEADEQVEDDERPRRGRFGGRRRATHPNPKVEKAMQRQADLKSAYRAIARAQKTLLAEIAQRTIDDLETNPALHQQAQEYNSVKAGLDNAYAKRCDQLKCQSDFNKEQLGKTMQAESYMVKQMYEESLAELKEEMLVELEHQMLSIARQAQLAENGLHNETDDEDDVVPMPKRTGYKFSRSGAIETMFDSRSRANLHTMRATTEIEGRFKMHELLKSLDEEDKPEGFDPGFTIMDSAHREVANHKKISLQNTNILADAAAQTKVVIPNEEALGLQLLGDLASRPALRSTIPPPLHSKPSRESVFGQTPPRPMPPHLQLHTGYGPNSIPVEMSPRTTQALHDRFDPSMPPPSTPNQGPTSFVHSPNAIQAEFPAMSPPVGTPRMNGQPYHRQSISQPGSRRGTMSEHMVSPGDRFNRGSELGPAPFRAGIDMPGWRQYPPQDQPPRRTSFSNDERTSFSFSSHLIKSGDRDSLYDPRPGEKREESDSIKHESSPHGPLRHPPRWPDPISQGGAPDARPREPPSPSGDRPWRMQTLAPRSPTHTRNVSAPMSVHDRRRDDEDGEERSKSKSWWGRKSSKADRGGQSRKHWSKDPQKLRTPLDKPGSAGSPTITSPSFAGSPEQRALPPAPWQGPPPPQHSPIGPPPPSAFHQPPSVPFGAPPPPQFSPGPPSHDYYHRNSFPPPQQQGAPASIWDNRQQSNLYALPTGPHHPPPPGVPPEQYARFQPPPPPSYHGPPHTPNPPQSAPGSSYGHSFGGPPLAPATPNTGFHPQGLRPAALTAPHQPAFAQQAQQSQGGRRRAQSDAHLTKFLSYQGPGQQRR